MDGPGPEDNTQRFMQLEGNLVAKLISEDALLVGYKADLIQKAHELSLGVRCRFREYRMQDDFIRNLIDKQYPAGRIDHQNTMSQVGCRLVLKPQ